MVTVSRGHLQARRGAYLSQGKPPASREAEEEEGGFDAPETREMGGDPGKLIRSVKGAAQKYLGVGFLLGFFLVLLTYFTVSEQFAISAPNGE